ncbi:SDR family NAD(P)-dependent oxidoreductase [Mycobacterium avium subsp. hominissuis]|nr:MULTISPECIES: SDR family NAD(P)-dependent oxidoreductase [Mycobacterium]RUP05989.1 MAG: SDR family NAD(P)-dependent oxidoreductase [Mycobacterium sp.]APA77176.1 SDR family NAD(P)-dependent oxidoreductase [Mycobacterium avium subsp. hominissuis]ETZ42907.1 short chain dehydrogenase family protein [Mycobacterium avium MAV_120709_2344]KZS85393.1 short-chain dehydrogenase [Mycobacterium persicum]MCA2334261.1 SDR family NAD(P)-dependent oxidoreductase [Mycobacterium avium]
MADHRVAVVTGANRGIGLQLASELARRGCTVVLGARDTAKGKDAARRLAGPPGRVLVCALDVADDASVRRAAEHLRAEVGHIDVLINNAGVDYDDDNHAVDVDMARAHRDIEVNLFGAWRITQALAPLLRRGAKVVNVSSGAGSFTETAGSGATPIYSVTKAALNMLTVKLAADLRNRNVLVNAVCPGWVATDMGGGGGRSIQDGAASVMWAVDLPDDGPSGGFFRDAAPIPW